VIPSLLPLPILRFPLNDSITRLTALMR
jgi:hypothetical protein